MNGGNTLTHDVRRMSHRVGERTHGFCHLNHRWKKNLTAGVPRDTRHDVRFVLCRTSHEPKTCRITLGVRMMRWTRAEVEMGDESRFDYSTSELFALLLSDVARYKAAAGAHKIFHALIRNWCVHFHFIFLYTTLL